MADDAAESAMLLIALVEVRPVLWDKSSEKYRHTGHTRTAWVEIFRKLNEDYDSMTPAEQETFSRETIKKWCNLRDAYVKSIRKNRRYCYGDQLQFLAKLYEGKETDPLEEEDKEAEDETRNSQLFHVEVNSEHLIACVERWSCLWDKSLATYKDKLHMKSAWLEVSRELNPEFDQMEANEQEHFRREIVKKWNNIRDTYAKSLKKSSSLPPNRVKKYVYADHMNFLRKFYTNDEPDDEEWRTQDPLNDDVLDPPDVVLHEHDDTGSLPTWDSQPETAQTHEKSTQHWSIGAVTVANPKKRKRSDQQEQEEVDHRIVNTLDRLEPENRHMSFFKGIIPSLENFDEDDVLEFQIQVLQIIKDVRKQKRENMASLASNSRGSSSAHRPTKKSKKIVSIDLSEHSNNSSDYSPKY